MTKETWTTTTIKHLISFYPHRHDQTSIPSISHDDCFLILVSEIPSQTPVMPANPNQTQTPCNSRNIMPSCVP